MFYDYDLSNRFWTTDRNGTVNRNQPTPYAKLKRLDLLKQINYYFSV